MREDLRQQVVDLFKREGPANTYEAFKCLETSLPETDIRENADEIVQIWKSQSKWTRQAQRDQRAPPTPSASSATTSNHWNSLEGRRPLKFPPQCTDDVSHTLSSGFRVRR